MPLRRRQHRVLAHLVERGRVVVGLVAVAGTDEAGQPIDVRDPMADYLKRAANSADPVTALLSIEAIFGPDLADNADVVATIQSAYQHLLDEGATKTVMAYLEQPALI